MNSRVARRCVLILLCVLALLFCIDYSIRVYRAHKAAWADLTRPERRYTAALGRELDAYLKQEGENWAVQTDVEDNGIILLVYGEPDETRRNNVIEAAKSIVRRQDVPFRVRIEFVRGSPWDDIREKEVVSSHIVKP